jgi:hypothetical protein
MTVVRKLAPLGLTILLLGGCGDGGGDTDGDESDAATTPTTAAQPACPPGDPDQYTGSTSEELCVTIERDDSGAVTSFEIEIKATCTVGFGEGGVVLSTDMETMTTSEAAFDAGQPFKVSVSMRQTPISVDSSGAFQSGNLTGTITDTEAEGSYQLDFTAQMVDEISCSGGPVTWTAAPS